jgi:predicted AAA+ superfamily ATPase
MLRDVLEYWNPWWTGDTSSLDELVHRPVVDDIRPWFARKEVLVITGVRRSGKSSVMMLLIKECLSTVPAKQVLYVNFDDLAFEEASIEDVIEEFERLMAPSGKMYVFLDEVQRKPGWERWLKRYYDGPADIKFVVSGSNSSLLMTEYSSYLTGRDAPLVMYPLDLRELASFNRIDVESEIARTSNRVSLQRMTEEYLRYGGFPEVVLEQDPKLKWGLLKGYFSAIIAHDILGRVEVREKGKLERLAAFLATNVSREASTKAMGKMLELNPATVQEYLDHFQDAYLFFQVNHHSYSLKAQYTYPRKVYCVDTGLRNAVGFRFSEDLGWLMENAVFLKVAREGEVYYWREGSTGVDFVVQEGTEVRKLVQVSYDLSDPRTRKREEGGLLAAMRHFGLDRGTIVTWDEEGLVDHDDLVMELIPLWRWLLD